MPDSMLKVENLVKEYKLGQIGGTTLREELQRWSAKVHHREDPTRKIGMDDYEYGETFRALDGVSFEVKKGERIGIIGRNGAGKSTLLKLISRITAPTSGDIWLNGRVASMLEVGTGFHGELTGRENIYMNGAILGMKKREIDAKMEDIIEFSECRQFVDTPVKRYSSGMYVKLAFSVAAHLDAEIVIMDEVLAVGDMAFQNKCLAKMNDISRNDGRTILYVSHYMNTIRQLCEKCVVLDHGRVTFIGNTEEAIAEYLGDHDISECRVDLDAMERDSVFRPQLIRMKAMECLDTAKPVFPVGSSLHLRLDCVAAQRIPDAFVRLIFRSADGTPVTMMTSASPVVLEEGEESHLDLKVDVSNFVPGRYSITPVLYEVNELGINMKRDGISDAFCFEIESVVGYNNNMQWLTQYWGHVSAAPIQVEVQN